MVETGIAPAHDEHEFDQLPENPPRFDAPIQLESRGTTAQKKVAPLGAAKPSYQQLLWDKHTIHKNTVAAKLRLVKRGEAAATLEKCHTIFTVAVCKGCNAVKKFPNRCDLFFCPECQPRLANDRRHAVEWWTKEINQPKHVVLTVKNVSNLNREHVREFKAWFRKLRRSKFARNWIGGFYSLEVTNEGNGWHLHLHALINAHWIDAIQLSAEWQRVTNGIGRIVKVRDARSTNYLAEVTKYVVKGVQLAAWPPETIATFIDAFTGVRTFGVFGSLYGQRTEFAEWFKSIKKSSVKCTCGCEQFNFFTEAEFLALDLVPDRDKSIPPPQASHEILFDFARPVESGPR